MDRERVFRWGSAAPCSSFYFHPPELNPFKVRAGAYSTTRAPLNPLLLTEQVAEKPHGSMGIRHAPSISWRMLASRA